MFECFCIKKFRKLLNLVCVHRVSLFLLGMSSGTIPMYIAESAPSHLRGQLVTLNNMFVTGGQLVAAVVAGLFSGRQDGWRFCSTNGSFMLFYLYITIKHRMTNVAKCLVTFLQLCCAVVLLFSLWNASVRLFLTIRIIKNEHLKKFAFKSLHRDLTQPPSRTWTANFMN